MNSEDYISQVYDNYNNLHSDYKYVYDAVEFMVGVLSFYSFESDQLFVSFNGGKDATIVLYLTQIALIKIYGKESYYNQQKIKCIYFEEQDSFEEVEDFIKQQINLLNLNMIRIQIQSLESNIKKGLFKLKSETRIQAVIMGTRKTDPFAENLERVSFTDRGYPPLLRINPILNWSYDQVWEFLLKFQIPYCSLYEKGYTYLGNKNSCVVNTDLRQKDGSIKPAWEAPNDIELQSRINHKTKNIKDQNYDSKVIYILCGKYDESLVEKGRKFNIKFMECSGVQQFVNNLLVQDQKQDIIIKYKHENYDVVDLIDSFTGKENNKVDL